VSSINSISSYVQPLASAKACQDDYTINAGLYGPVVASAIGVANAAADSASAICSFSAESLGKLGDMADAGYDAVGTALSDTGNAVESAFDSVTNGFTQLYSDVAAMANDGLLPKTFAKIHPKYGTPHITTWITGISCAIIAGLFPLNLLGELISIGTLLAFALVCAGVLVLRRTQPNLPRPFRTPWVPLIPVLGILICIAQMFSLPNITWLNLTIWLALGFAVYFGYSRKHSKLARPNG